MPFATFMRMALYQPGLGYYQRRIPGADADYRTSPTLSPWFGRLIARGLERMWESLGRPDPFIVAEVGPGGAELAFSAAESMKAPMREVSRWYFVEPFSHIADIQRERMLEARIATEWYGSLTDISAFTGCILANEVVDNFPVHVFEVEGGKAKEVMIGLDEDRLATVLTEIRDPMLLLRTAEPVAYLDEGDRFEVCLHYDEWSKAAAAALERGYLLLFDYGDKEPELWQRQPAGTVVTYYRQMLGVDPLEHPGETDITAHVNFSALARSLSTVGLHAQPIMTQRDFLSLLGIDRVNEQLREEQQRLEQQGSHADSVKVLAERSKVETLVSLSGLGRLQVLLSLKNAPYPDFG